MFEWIKGTIAISYSNKNKKLKKKQLLNNNVLVTDLKQIYL